MLALLQTPLPSLPFREVWTVARPKQGFGLGFETTAVVGGRLLFVERTADARGRYGAMDLGTGKRLWSVPIPLEITNGLAVGDKYAAVAGEHRLLVFDPKTGHRVWQGIRQGYGAGPLLVGGRLIAELKHNVLTALDLRQGRLAWRSVFPARVQTKTGFDRTYALGDSLWTADAAGMVSRVANKDGRTLWSRPSKVGEVTAFVPMENAVAVVGTLATEALRSADGRSVWRNTAATGFNPAYYQAATRQLWRVTGNGELFRFDAPTGRLLARSSARPDRNGPTFEPVPYRGGLLILNTGPVVRLDAQGRQSGEFDPQEGIHELWAVGDDLVLNSVDRVVRFTPGTPPPPKDPDALARRLVAKPVLAPRDRRALLTLGHAAVPAPPRRPARRPRRARGGSRPRPRETRGQVGHAPDLRRRPRQGRLQRARKDDARPRGLASRDGGCGSRRRSPAAPLPRDHCRRDEPLRRRVSPARHRGPCGRRAARPLEGPGDAARRQRPDLRRDRPLRSRRRVGRDLTSTRRGSEAQSTLGGVRRRQGLRSRRSVRRRRRQPLRARRGQNRDPARPLRPLRRPLPLRRAHRPRGPDRLRSQRRSIRTRRLAGRVGARPTGQGARLRPEGALSRLHLSVLRFEPGERSGATVEFSEAGNAATARIGVTYGGLDGTGFAAKLRKMRGEWYVISLRMTWIS